MLPASSTDDEDFHWAAFYPASREADRTSVLAPTGGFASRLPRLGRRLFAQPMHPKSPESARKSHDRFQPLPWTQGQPEPSALARDGLASFERFRLETQSAAGYGAAASILDAHAADRRRIARDVGVGKDRDVQVLPGKVAFDRSDEQAENQSGHHAQSLLEAEGRMENA